MDDYCDPDKCCVTHFDPIDTLEESFFLYHDQKGGIKLKINRFRIIDKFEADYNSILKLY